MEFRLKSRSPYGLLYWQGQSPDMELANEDYMAISLNDGHLVFTYELGGGAGQLISAERVNDGREHSVRITRRGRNGTLEVDRWAL